jgi:phosphate-selective porin OprO/OprP
MSHHSTLRSLRNVAIVIAAVLVAAPAFAQTTSPPQEKPVPLAGGYDNGYLVAQSADGAYKYWLDGRLNLDWAMYRGQKNRLASGFEVRRARIGVKATIATHFLTELDVDFADNLIEMKDMWAGFAGIKNTLIKVGNHKAPFGFDTLTSSKNIMFIERSYLDSWAPDRLLGLNVSHWEKYWQASAGIYGQAAGDFNDKDTLTGGGAGTSQRPSYVGRVSVAPINTETQSLHIGGGIAWRQPDVAKITTSGADLVDRLDASRIASFSSRAETHVSRAKFLNTGDMKYVDHYLQLGAELAGTFGPVSFQSEYQKTDVVRTHTTVAAYSDHTFSGYYGQVMVFLTKGDHRPYLVSDGEFDRVHPKSDRGAVEVGIRYSRLDLDDATTVDPILGGIGKNVMLGATYFMNTNHKLVFNFGWVDNNSNAKPNKEFSPLATGTGTAQTVIYGDHFKIISVRYQIAF